MLYEWQVGLYAWRSHLVRVCYNLTLRLMLSKHGKMSESHSPIKGCVWACKASTIEEYFHFQNSWHDWSEPWLRSIVIVCSNLQANTYIHYGLHKPFMAANPWSEITAGSGNVETCFISYTNNFIIHTLLSILQKWPV